MQEKRKYVFSILDFYERESSVSTEFGRVYSNLRYYAPERTLKAVLVTSPALGEGKSTLASLLAIEVSHRYNKKVILMDCDLRRPILHHLFALERSKGMAELLLGKANFQDCLKFTSLESLKVMTSGQEIQNPSELLESLYFGEVITEAKHYSDLLVIDSAPIIPVSDPLIIGAFTDGAILVLKAGHTQREIGKRAVEILKNSQVNLLGVIMNNMKEILPYYYNYKYYGYEYSSSRKRR